MKLDFTDSVYMLKKRTDDPEPLQKELSLYFERFEFFEIEGVSKPVNAGTIECSLYEILRHEKTDETAMDITRNHLAMIQKAYQEGKQTALFLEDDVHFELREMETWRDRLLSWVHPSHHHVWDILYLGYCPFPLILSFWTAPGFIRVFTPLTSHAYVLNRHGMEKILGYASTTEGKKPCHIDKMFTKIPSMRKYAVFPMMAFQKKDPALYLKACDHISTHISFTTLCKTFEWLSLFFPILFLFLLIWFVYRMIVYRFHRAM